MVLPDEVRRTFQAAAVCYLATCGEGAPNVVPVGFKWMLGEDLLLGDLYFGKTRRNLFANPLVAVTVATAQPKAGFQLKGRATIHRGGPPLERLGALLRSAGVEAEPHAAVVIAVNEIYRLDPGARAGERLAPSTRATP